MRLKLKLTTARILMELNDDNTKLEAGIKAFYLEKEKKLTVESRAFGDITFRQRK